MKLFTKILIVSSAATAVRGELEHQLIDNRGDAALSQSNNLDALDTHSSKHKRKMITSLKVRRLQKEVKVDSPWHFDALANMKVNLEYPDVHLAGASANEAADIDMKVKSDEKGQKSKTKDPEAVGVNLIDDPEISTIHKDTTADPDELSTKQISIQTERDLLAQLRRGPRFERGPRFDYDVNRSKRGSDAFINQTRGKVGKLVSNKRGKVGKLNMWDESDDDWWGSGKSAKGSKSGKSSKSSNGWDDDDYICWEDDDWMADYDPTLSPTLNPTLAPTVKPRKTKKPTRRPAISIEPPPTLSPTLNPTLSPTLTPSITPTLSPTLNPTQSPTLSPSLSPSLSPTISPTLSPTLSPSLSPTLSPTLAPTLSPIKDNRKGIKRDDDDVFVWADDDEAKTYNSKEGHNKSRQLGFLDWDDDDYRERTTFSFRRRSGKATGRSRNSGKSGKSSKTTKSSDWCRLRRNERQRRRKPSNDKVYRRPSIDRPR